MPAFPTTAATLLLAGAVTIAVAVPGYRSRNHAPAVVSRVEVPPPGLPMPKSSAFRLDLPAFHRFVEDGRGLVLDARPGRIYQEGRVPGALSLPLEDFETAHAILKPCLEADKARPLAIYCSNPDCRTGGELRRKLIALGHTRVSLFPGGWSAWREAGLPEESSATAN